jgi:glycosyltransferase involved in cell wall biosynthesis
LKNILEKLINDDRLRMEVAKNGREFALKNFTSDIMAEKTLEVYQKVINL